MHRTIQRYLHTVLAAVVAYLAMIVTAAASPVNFVSAGKIKVFLDKRSTAPSRATAAATCKEKGGILLADYTPAVQEMYMEPFVNAGVNYLCQSTSSGWNRNCYGSYTEGQATAGPCDITRREAVYGSAFDAVVEAKQCPYRWSLGWFGRYTNNLGQVGVNFYDSSWADLAFDGSDPSQIRTADYMRNYERMVSDTSTLNIYAGGPANDYDDGVMWNASFQCRDGGSYTTMAACIPPHGNPYVALGARQLSGASGGYYGVRVDAPASPNADPNLPLNTPFVPNNYVVACQWQGVEASYYASTTLPPQPPMVPDWKQPTWIQSHWWIIYLVFAVVLLALLVAFIVWYECKHRVPEPLHATQVVARVKSDPIASPETSTMPNHSTAQATNPSTAVIKPAQAPDASEPSVFPPQQEATQEATQQQTQQPTQQATQQAMQQPMQQQTLQPLPEHSEDSPIPAGIGDQPTLFSSLELLRLRLAYDAFLKLETARRAEEAKEEAERRDRLATMFEEGATRYKKQAALHNPPADPPATGNNPLAEAEMAPVARSAPDVVQTSATGAAPATRQAGGDKPPWSSQSPDMDKAIANTIKINAQKNIDFSQPENRWPEDYAGPAPQRNNGGLLPRISIPDAIDVETVSSVPSDDSVERVRLGGRPRFTTTQAATKTAVPGAPGRQRSPIQARNGGRAGPPAPATAHITSPQGMGGQEQPAQQARAAPVQIPAALPLPAANAVPVRARVPAAQAAQGTRAPAVQPAQGARAAANPVNMQALNSPSDELYPGVWDSPVWDGYGSIHKPNDDDM